MTMATLVTAARELIILLDGIVDLQRIVASQERFLIPVLLTLYCLVFKPLAAYRESTMYDGSATAILGL